MNSADPHNRLKMRAMEELKALLEQSHAIRLTEVHQSRGCRIDLLAKIDVYGHIHTLACAVKGQRNGRATDEDLRRLCDDVGRQTEVMMPILIAPHLPRKLQTLCIEKKVGFLDFEGNGRLVLDEAFIGRRTLHHGPASHPNAPVT